MSGRMTIGDCDTDSLGGDQSGCARPRTEDGRVTRIEGKRTEPGGIEHLVAMLLCRENPAATHIRPSRGDGGIDVLVPADDGSGIIVYQVKSFHSNLTASQKAQVERSFHRLVDFAKAHDLKVLEWYLTLPLDPTTENLLDWLADLRAHAKINTEMARQIHSLVSWLRNSRSLTRSLPVVSRLRSPRCRWSLMSGPAGCWWGLAPASLAVVGSP